MSFLGSKSVLAQTERPNIHNARSFFQKITKNGGVWWNKNEKFDPKNKDDFSHFIIEFYLDEIGGLTGTILGLNGHGEKIVFWKINEFINPSSGEVVFIQRSNFGFAVASSVFSENDTRKSEFELMYNNGGSERHRDRHYFIDENTMISESEIFNPTTKDWIKQPSQKWTRKF
ncbi:MAG: hypothetical protein Aureis2KO_00480 [Aureisphaera sp.]